MSKPIIINAPLAVVAVTAKQWLKADGSGAVTVNDTAGSEIGVAESSADNSATPNVLLKNENIGMIKQGLIKLNAVAATYNVGDLVELATGGQNLQAYSSGAIVGSVCETKVLAATGELLVYINLA